MSTRYHLIPVKDHDGMLILDTQSGAIQYPICWQDIAAYYYYLVGCGRISESQNLLAESIAGNKPITTMIVRMSQTGMDIN